MKTKLILTLRNGHSVKGTIDRPFEGSESEIEVHEPDLGKSLYPMDRIAHILLEELPSWAGPLKHSGVEDVQTLNGDNFRVIVHERKGRSAKGFFGTILGEPLVIGFKAVFFVKTAVRFRHQEKSLGDILLEKGFITPEKIDKALDTQKALRDRRIGDLISETAKVPKDEIEKTLRSSVKSGRRNARVGDTLIVAGLVTREQVEKAFDSQVSGKRLRVGELLLKQGHVTEEQLLAALAAKFQLRFVDLTGRVPTDEALAALSEGFVKRLQVLPLEIDAGRLVVATSSPTNHAIGDDIRFCTKHEIELVAAAASQIAKAIETHYHQKPEEVHLPTDLAGISQVPTVEEEEEEERESLYVEPDSEVISLVNRILIDATARGASDIHFEPGGARQPVVIRYRIDGECLVAHRISHAFRNSIISRLKILASLDIAERRKPQSGKFMLRLEKKRVEYRVEITPTVGRLEDAVLRILSASKPMSLDGMEFLPPALAGVKEISGKPYGIILCVGPTGSGKTTTLHSILAHINRPTRKIWTAEDPVEITQPGLRQVQVNHRIGFTFPEAMRSFLRGDPDVIMIGEMRDAETARVTIEASLTGHLVLSTLHTNNAPETAVRLIEMGMDPFNFADAMLGIIAQRLCRRLCAACKRKAELPRNVYDAYREEFLREAPSSYSFPDFDSTMPMGPVGCPQCNGTGYRGRVALQELMMGTPAVKDIIRKKGDVAQVKRIARKEGMMPLKMDGILKVLQGITDMDQVHKVCM